MGQKAKEHLRSFKCLQAEIVETEKQLAKIRTAKTHPSFRTDSESKDKNRKDLSGYAAAVDDLESTLYRYRMRRVEEATRIISVLECMDPREAQVIRLHYMQGMDWQRVADRMGFSESHIHRIHAAALRNFDIVERNADKEGGG